MLWHDDFFTLPNGETEPIFRIGKLNDLVIQHPYFPFGSPYNPYLWKKEKLANSEYSTPVYLLQFEVASETDVFDFHGLLSQIERNWHLKPDESLWFETGFWSIVIDGISFMGIGLQRLSETLTEVPGSKFALCLANNDSIIVVGSGKSRNRTVLLSIYASNENLPFAEVVEPFRKSIEGYSSKNLLKNEILREENLRRFWFAGRSIHLDPIAYIIDREHGDHKILPIIKNEFKRTKDSVIGKIENLIGTTHGGFIETDYTSKRLCTLHAEIWKLESLSLAEFSFELA
jgi:hypothetical protein